MFMRRLLKKIAKQEGKRSYASQKLVQLKTSKEFKYLVDIQS